MTFSDVERSISPHEELDDDKLVVAIEQSVGSDACDIAPRHSAHFITISAAIVMVLCN